MFIRLVVTAGPNQGREYTFRQHDTFLVGRSREVHFALPDDPYLSRMHFLIELNPPLCHLQDLDSHNGTKINGKKTPGRTLRHGDEIEVGRTRLRVAILTEQNEPLGMSVQTLSMAGMPATLPLPFDAVELIQALAGRTGSTRLDALLEHQASLWERGRRAEVGHYLQALPDLAESPDLLVALIAQEVDLRRDRGETVTRAEYLRRFPEVAQLLEVELARQEKAALLAGKLRQVMPPVRPFAPAPPVGAAIPGYRLLRPLGEGGMGIVYLASDLQGQHVALKMIRPAVTPDASTLARFLREADILRQLAHPHIVGYRAHGEYQGLLYFVMDYIEGTDAETEVRRHGALPMNRAVGWIVQLLEALEYAHDRGFVHRDIKPANLLIGRRGAAEHLRLADFGLARTYTDSQLSGLTCSGAMGGTVGYIAPEQILHFREVKPVSDQYAAAATLYHLLSGAHLYDQRGSAVAMLKRVLTDDPVDLKTWRPELPAALVAAIHRALSRQPEQRHASVAAFRQTLLPFAGPG